MKSALILYPHQLFPAEQLPDVQRIVMVEDPLVFGINPPNSLRLHKQKLILLRASMQRYVEEVLWPGGYQVDYIELDVFMNANDLLEHVKGFDHVYAFDPVDEMLTQRLLQARREREGGPPLDFLQSPNFYLKEQEVRDYLSSKKTFPEFYQWQRERFDILIGDDYKPLGGSWLFEHEDSEGVPENEKLPSFGVFGGNKHVERAVEWVEKHFPENPGSTDFIWPTNHAEAETWLEDFVENRLDNYAKYQDAIHAQAPWLFHSALSANLNIGLLSPQQVVEAALRRHAKQPVDLPSLECFVRQILGWREYVRGMYLVNGAVMRGHTANTFKSQRRMTPAWRQGSLGLPPFDDLVRKLNNHGYAHNIERLLIAGNLMMLCEIHPEDIYKWFSELFIDAQDWIMTPNIYALGQLQDSSTKLAIAPSSVILQQSNYERGDWTDVWDGLYWRFIEKHRDVFRHNARMRPAVQRLERLDPDRKRIIGYRADDFLNNFTQ